jgi:PPK2 family polyphosphate:nucleotide phosphotransferase
MAKGKRKGTQSQPSEPRLSDLLRVPAGPIDLRTIDPGGKPGFDGGKAAGKKAQAALAPRLAELQEQLFAEGRSGGERNLLLILQGLDTSGKGGTVRHVVGQVDPQGVHAVSFGPPTAEERRHDFLWRVRRQLPASGKLGVFDRSHYEDVLVARVRELVPRSTWRRRYGSINRFEERLAANGTRVVKCFLHISAQESRERLLARLDNPTKHWKFSPEDVDDRAYWEDYLDAYADAIERCGTEYAPWHVIPADHKWYRNWAITKLLIEELEEMALRWPAARFDVDEQRARLLSSP